MTSLRPDELASESDIERDRNVRSKIKGTAKSVVSTAIVAGTGYAFPSIASKVAPFLNRYIPTELALKGINKVSPELGAFLKKGMEKGLDVKEGLNFIKDKIQSKSLNENKKNIIEQYSPELNQFILDQINKGKTPFAAGTLARTLESNNKFKNVIKKIEKDHKLDWPSIIESIYGNQSTASQSQNQEQPIQPAQSEMTNSSQQQQSGQGQQALAAILQKINAKLGGQ